MGRGGDHTANVEKDNSPTEKSYNQPNGSQKSLNTRGVLHEVQRPTPKSVGDAQPPGFPSIEELKKLNHRIHADAGSLGLSKLDQPSPLESSLDNAVAEYSPDADGIIRTAAFLVYGIASSQAFRDGNRRTAYFAAYAFLLANGYGHIYPKDGFHLLARRLNQLIDNPTKGQPPPTVQSFVEIFTRRLNNSSTQ